MTYALALLTEPSQTTPQALSLHLSRIQSWILALSSLPLSPSSTSFIPSAELLATFRPSSIEGPLPSNQPIREIEIVKKEKVWDELKVWLEEIGESLDVWEGWRQGGGWMVVRVSFCLLTSFCSGLS